MNRVRYLLALIAVAVFPTVTYAENSSSEDPIAHHCDRNDYSHYDSTLNEKDWDDLRDYLNTKRTINLAEKSCNLTIAGDVRIDWRHVNERGVTQDTNGDAKNLRGSKNRFSPTYQGGKNQRIGRNDFDIEVNLYFDYVCDRGWAVTHFQFDNSAGVIPGKDNECRYGTDDAGWKGSGYCCDLCVKKAYIGYNLLCECDTRLDIEVGRRNLYNVFDSEVQFLSRFDGFLVKYRGSLECWANYYVNLAGFVVDENVNHYAYAFELGLLDIRSYGVDFKYSFIDWKKRGRNRCMGRNPEGFDFQNSQLTLVYHLSYDLLCAPSKFYGAFVYNHAPNNLKVDGHKREARYAWYTGFRMGDVVHCGDYAIDVQYQYVQAQSIPDKDVSGIGRGNVRDDSFTDGNLRGNTNYKGWRVEGLYAFTDNMTFNVCLEASRQIDKDMGGRHHYSMFQFETIYAF